LETLRVYLTGKVCVERDDRLVPERRLPGGQGRLVFAYLAAEHERAVHRDELADELWHGEPPRAWEAALRVVISKLRAALEEVGLDGSAAVSSALGCYQIRFPAGTWIDLEAAATRLTGLSMPFGPDVPTRRTAGPWWPPPLPGAPSWPEKRAPG
jgi:SARP family transcriptional regulator, regulator of embCAB operon